MTIIGVGTERSNARSQPSLMCISALPRAVPSGGRVARPSRRVTARCRGARDDAPGQARVAGAECADAPDAGGRGRNGWRGFVCINHHVEEENDITTDITAVYLSHETADLVKRELAALGLGSGHPSTSFPRATAHPPTRPAISTRCTRCNSRRETTCTYLKEPARGRPRRRLGGRGRRRPGRASIKDITRAPSDRPTP